MEQPEYKLTKKNLFFQNKEMKEITKKEFNSSLNFRSQSSNLTSNISLDKILPVDSYLSYCVIILEVIMKQGNEYRCYNDLDSFFKLFNVDKNEYNLLEIKRQFSFFESDHILTKELKDFLTLNARNSKEIYISCDEDSNTSHYWRMELVEFFNMEDFLDELPVNFGEFTIFDEKNNWFIKAWDDDPFICLAAKDLLIRQITEICSNKALHVSKDFIWH